jgi:hypothetical protein
VWRFTRPAVCRIKHSFRYLAAGGDFARFLPYMDRML